MLHHRQQALLQHQGTPKLSSRARFKTMGRKMLTIILGSDDSISRGSVNISVHQASQGAPYGPAHLLQGHASSRNTSVPTWNAALSQPVSDHSFQPRCVQRRIIMCRRHRSCERCGNHRSRRRKRCDGCARRIGPVCYPERCLAVDSEWLSWSNYTLCIDCWTSRPERRLRLLARDFHNESWDIVLQRGFL